MCHNVCVHIVIILSSSINTIIGVYGAASDRRRRRRGYLNYYARAETAYSGCGGGIKPVSAHDLLNRIAAATHTHTRRRRLGSSVYAGVGPIMSHKRSRHPVYLSERFLRIFLWKAHVLDFWTRYRIDYSYDCNLLKHENSSSA